MNKRYIIQIDFGSGYVTIPDSCIMKIEPISIKRDKKQYFVQKELSKIILRNTPDMDVYSQIKNKNFDNEFLIKVIGYGLTITGYFSKLNCSLKNDKLTKEVTIEPSTYDQYTPVLESIETEVDVLKGGFEEVEAETTVLDNTLQNIYSQTLSKNKIKIDPDWNLLLTDGVTFNNRYDAFFNEDGSPKIDLLNQNPFNASDKDGLYVNDFISIYEDENYELSSVTVVARKKEFVFFGQNNYPINVRLKFSRQRIFQADEPDGDGWESETDTPVNYYGKSGYWWTRKPFGGGTGNWTLREVENNYDGSRTSEYVYPVNEQVTYSGGFYLMDLFNYVYKNMSSELSEKNVKSLFFNNDEASSYSFMSGRENQNYVSWERNLLNDIICRPTSYFFIESEENPLPDDLSELNIKFKELFEDLNILFNDNLFWFVDESGDLHIEHIKYLDLLSTALDVSDQETLINTDNFNFDDSELFSEIKINQINAGTKLFKSTKLKFEKATTNKRNNDNKLDNTTTIITTDVEYCAKNPNSLENGILIYTVDESGLISKGFTEQEEIGGSRRSVISTGRSEEAINYKLTLPFILKRYARYEGVWFTGKINDEIANFERTKRVKIGEDLNLRGIHYSLNYISNIGIGIIENGSMDFEKGTTKIKLKYRYNASKVSQTALLVASEGNAFEL